MKFRSFYTVRFLLPLFSKNEERIEKIVLEHTDVEFLSIVRNLINRSLGIWTTVNVYAGKENSICTRIKNMASKHVYQVENFHSIKLSDGSLKKYVPYNRLPGYIVVRCSSSDALFNELVKENIFYKNWQNKIKVIKKDDIAQIISWEFKRLKTFLDIQDVSKKTGTEFSVGDSVMITSGPLSNVVLTVDEVYPEIKKAKMLATFFGRYTPIEASFDKLKKVKKS